MRAACADRPPINRAAAFATAAPARSIRVVLGTPDATARRSASLISRVVNNSGGKKRDNMINPTPCSFRKLAGNRDIAMAQRHIYAASPGPRLVDIAEPGG
jgi:hypothetical protein